MSQSMFSRVDRMMQQSGLAEQGWGIAYQPTQGHAAVHYHTQTIHVDPNFVRRADHSKMRKVRKAIQQATEGE